MLNQHTNKKPKVSVLMPVYNGEKYLKEAIQSILDQTFLDFELVIINDGSTDASVDVIQAFKDPRIFLYQNDQNYGLIETLNRGLKYCQGTYIARMDQDDISKPERFRMQYDFLEENLECVLVGSWAEIIDQQGTIIGQKKTETAHLPLKYQLLLENCFTHTSIFFRREEILYAGGYQDKYVASEDYELYTRLIQSFRLAVLPLSLVEYRVHPDSITQDKEKRRERHAVIDLVVCKYIRTFLELDDMEIEKFKYGNIRLMKKVLKSFINAAPECDEEEIKRFMSWYKHNVYTPGRIAKLWLKGGRNKLYKLLEK